MAARLASMLPTLCAVVLSTAAALTHAPPGHAADGTGDEQRIALIIGNSDYARSPLKNPVNDARAMAEALERLGFEVELQENATLTEMIGALRRFTAAASENDVRLFYYAGHGIQVKGRNYLIPVDAELMSEDEVGFKSADVNELLERLGQLRSGLNIMILDACRNNPFANLNFVGPDGRLVRFRGSGRPGLAPVDAPAGTLVAFATAPGSVAMDGGNQRNSLYTRHLLDHIGAPGLPVEQLFKRVRIAVAQETKWLQVPWESSSLMGDFCFRTPPDGQCSFGGGSLVDTSRFAR